MDVVPAHAVGGTTNGAELAVYPPPPPAPSASSIAWAELALAYPGPPPGQAAGPDESSSDDEDSDDPQPKEIGEVDPAKCKVSGPGFSGAGAQRPVRLFFHAHDHWGRRLKQGGDELVVRVQPASSSMALPGPIEVAMVDNGNGTYAATYTAPQKGNYFVSVEVNYLPISGSPFPVFFGNPGDPDAAELEPSPPPPGDVDAVVSSNPAVAAMAAAAKQAMEGASLVNEVHMRTIYATNMSPAVAQAQYQQLFSIAGKIRDIKLAGDGLTAMFILEYATIGEAEEAHKMDGMMVGDRALKVQNGVSYQASQSSMTPASLTSMGMGGGVGIIGHNPAMPNMPVAIPGIVPGMDPVTMQTLLAAQEMTRMQAQMDSARAMADQVAQMRALQRTSKCTGRDPSLDRGRVTDTIMERLNRKLAGTTGDAAAGGGDKKERSRSRDRRPRSRSRDRRPRSRSGDRRRSSRSRERSRDRRAREVERRDRDRREAERREVERRERDRRERDRERDRRERDRERSRERRPRGGSRDRKVRSRSRDKRSRSRDKRSRSRDKRSRSRDKPSGDKPNSDKPSDRRRGRSADEKRRRSRSPARRDGKKAAEEGGKRARSPEGGKAKDSEDDKAGSPPRSPAADAGAKVAADGGKGGDGSPARDSNAKEEDGKEEKKEKLSRRSHSRSHSRSRERGSKRERKHSKKDKKDRKDSRKERKSRRDKGSGSDSDA
jgi:hypothetical protein